MNWYQQVSILASKGTTFWDLYQNILWISIDKPGFQHQKVRNRDTFRYLYQITLWITLNKPRLYHQKVLHFDILFNFILLIYFDTYTLLISLNKPRFQHQKVQNGIRFFGFDILFNFISLIHFDVYTRIYYELVLLWITEASASLDFSISRYGMGTGCPPALILTPVLMRVHSCALFKPFNCCWVMSLTVSPAPCLVNVCRRRWASRRAW